MVSSVTFWNKKAKRYAARAVDDPKAYEAALARVRAHLGRDDRVLELGCGTGTTALKLADAVASIDAWDHAGAMIEIARAKEDGTGRVTFHAGEIEEAVAAGPYDAIMAFNLLHLLNNLPGALREIHGALRPGGLFISKTFCAPETGGGWLYKGIRITLPAMQLVGMAPPVTFRRVAELEAAVRAAGFEIVEAGNYPESPPRRFLVARRTG